MYTVCTIVVEPTLLIGTREIAISTAQATNSDRRTVRAGSENSQITTKLG